MQLFDRNIVKLSKTIKFIYSKLSDTDKINVKH